MRPARPNLLPALCVALLFCAALGACGDVQRRAGATPLPLGSPGELAYDLLDDFTAQHPVRRAGNDSERAAADYIADRFAEYGYGPILEEVTAWTLDGKRYESANVVAVKQGDSARRIIVGAHYDSRDEGEGATDNGAGVALVLEVAARLRNERTPCTVEFVAFGAEETGWWGSRDYFADTVTGTRGDVVCMVNLDVSAGGDRLYAHSESGPLGWPRDQALRIAADLDVPLQAQPGLSPDHPRGTAGDWSDHRWFRQGGIPYLWIQSTNWNIGKQDGFTTTRKAGKIWHTSSDTVAFVDATFPGRLERQLGQVTAVLTRFLTAPPPRRATALPPAPAPSPAMPQP